MAKWGGILAGAVAGGAGAAQDMARGAIEDERKLSLTDQLSAIEEKRQMRIAEAAELRRRAGRQADTEQDLANAPRVRESAVADKRAVGTAAADVEREATIAAGSDPSYLKSKKAIAVAGQAPERYSPDTLARAELTRIQVGDEKKRRELLDRKADIESGSLRGDQRARALKQIDQQLAQLERATAGKKVDEYDTEKVREETSVDPLTGEPTTKTVRERIEKRRPTPGKKEEPAAAAPEAPRDMAQRKVGTTYNTPRGPAVWRGNGWELVR
jgi:hypothetical protein